jgi:preprotein translocase subunit YajC
MGPLLLLILLFAIAWVVLILPKQRELKRHNALVASLEVGDEVMTGSGFYGTLTEVTDDTVLVELAPGIEVKLARRAVAAKVVAPVETPETATPAADADADEDEDVDR